MPAYIIADITVTNAEGYVPYREAAQKSIAAHGGRYIARGGEVQVLEGNWNPARLVIIEFPSMDAARKWYHSPEYQQALKIRHAHSSGHVILTEGLPS